MHDKYKQKLDFLDQNLFYGLNNLNNGFANLSMRFFSTKDFLVVMERCKILRFGIFGIEGWLVEEKTLYITKYYEQFKTYAHDGQWYFTAYNELLTEEKDLMFAATYYIPSYDI